MQSPSEHTKNTASDTDSTPSTTDSTQIQGFAHEPMDLDEDAKARAGMPYKRVDGSWSDGGTDSHTPTGRFRDGYKGNAILSQRRWELHVALSAAIKPEDILEIMLAMMKKAKAGDRQCAEMVMKYAVGDPTTVEVMNRIRALEAASGVAKVGETVQIIAETDDTLTALKLAEAEAEQQVNQSQAA